MTEIKKGGPDATKSKSIIILIIIIIIIIIKQLRICFIQKAYIPLSVIFLKDKFQGTPQKKTWKKVSFEPTPWSTELMVVAISSAAYMAYQRGQARVKRGR